MLLQGGMRRTALHWACQGGHVRMVELLMDFGADTKVHRLGTCCKAALLPPNFKAKRGHVPKARRGVF